MSETVLGNTAGLKPNHLRRLEKLYDRRVQPQRIITQEFARQLTELSFEIRRQVGVLVDRSGYVASVMVGDATSIEIPDIKRVRAATSRFRGVRLLHTHLRGEQLTQDDLTDLALLRLDLVAAVTMDDSGIPALVHTAHLVPNGDGASGTGSLGTTQPWTVLAPTPPSLLEDDFLELIESLEAEFARTRQTRSASDKRDRAILVNVTTVDVDEAKESMDELAELARSSGVVVLDSIVQKRNQLDPRTLVGSGKLKELLIHAMQLGVDMIIFDRDLTPSQVVRQLIREYLARHEVSYVPSGQAEAAPRRGRRR